MIEEWYYQRAEQRFGPVSATELRRLARCGELQPTDLVWKEGMSQAVAASRSRDLFPTNPEKSGKAHGASNEDDQWFVRLQREVVGPLSWQELRLLLQQGGINGKTLVSRDRQAWQKVASVEGLTPGSVPRPENGDAHVTSEWLETGKMQARVIFQDLRQMDFRDEILPVDASNLAALLKDGVFWFATLLGIVPLLIGTLSETTAQLTAFALFFAAVWGIIFRSAILKYDCSWKSIIPALFFTGLLGTSLAGKLESMLLRSDFPFSEDYLPALLQFIVVIGVTEELSKFLPVAIYVLWRRAAANPMTIVLIGVFSGLGFAAFENLTYGQLQIFQTLHATARAGTWGLAEGVQGAMVNVMLRSLSLVFCHAVWAGIFAYFLARAVIARRRWGAMILVGLGLTATLHGAYDWLAYLQPTLAALTAGASFVLFYGYAAKLRGMENVAATVSRSEE